MTQRNCSVEDCGKPHRAKGFCAQHYYANKAWPICSVQGCETLGRRSGYCGRHFPEACLVVDCERPRKTRGFCGTHERHTQTGSCTICGATFVGDARRQFCSPDCRAIHDAARFVEYAGAHRRVQVVRGSAKQHPCVDCGVRAADWSYTNDDPDALVSKMTPTWGLPYSTDIDRYAPRCKACHKVFDQAHSATPNRGERNPRSKLTEAQVREIRARYAAGGIGFQRLANEFEVSKKLVLNIVHRRTWAWLT